MRAEVNALRTQASLPLHQAGCQLLACCLLTLSKGSADGDIMRPACQAFHPCVLEWQDTSPSLRSLQPAARHLQLHMLSCMFRLCQQVAHVHVY